MVGAYKAPISYLFLHKPKTRIQNSHTKASAAPIFRAQVPSRRLFIFSLPLSSFLFLPTSNSYAATVYDPVSASERDASALVSQRVSQAVELLEKGRELQAQGDFSAALDYYSKVMCTHLAILYVLPFFKLVLILNGLSILVLEF